MKKTVRKIITDVGITDLGINSKGIARIEGMIVFVDKAIPGDVVEIEIYKKKRNFAEASLVRIIQPSPDRIQPVCSHFDLCGGCTVQNMTYAAQLKLKQKMVTDAFEHIGMLRDFTVFPMIPSENTLFYRNKLEFSFSSQRWLSEDEIRSGEEIKNRDALGFHIPGKFDKIFQVEKCWLQPDPSNEIRNFVYDFAIDHGLSFFDVRNMKGLLRSMIIKTSTGGEVMTAMIFGDENPESISLTMNALAGKFPSLTSLYYMINTKKNDSLYGLEPVLFQGEPYIHEIIDGIRYRIGPKSFFQANTRQAEKMHKKIAEFAGIKETDHVYDLYSGVGTISLYMAGISKMVTGIETVPESVTEALANAEINGITNTRFFAGEVEKLLNEEFFRSEGRPDVIIVDPPRTGLHVSVIESILQSGCPKVIYVSCNPATQARDLRLLSARYKVVSLQPVDMFPQTLHVENIASLELMPS